MKKFFNTIFTSILLVILFVSTTLVLILLPVKKEIKGNAIKEIVSSLEIEKMIEENDNFKQEIDEVFEPVFTETNKLGIDSEIIIKIIDTKEVKDLIGSITENIANYIITGENQKIIINDDINNLVNNAIDKINSSGYNEINEAQKNEILNIVDEKITEYQEIIPDTSIIDKEMPKENKEALNIIRFILGNKLLTYLIVAMIISTILLIILKFKKFKWIKYVSVTVLISSIFTSIITFIMLASNKIIFNDYPYIFNIVNKIINSSIILYISIFLIMVIILIIYKIKNKKIIDIY